MKLRKIILVLAMVSFAATILAYIYNRTHPAPWGSCILQPGGLPICTDGLKYDYHSTYIFAATTILLSAIYLVILMIESQLYSNHKKP